MKNKIIAAIWAALAIFGTVFFAWRREWGWFSLYVGWGLFMCIMPTLRALVRWRQHGQWKWGATRIIWRSDYAIITTFQPIPGVGLRAYLWAPDKGTRVENMARVEAARRALDAFEASDSERVDDDIADILQQAQQKR